LKTAVFLNVAQSNLRDKYKSFGRIKLVAVGFNKMLVLVRFEDFTAVTMKNGVFWDVTPCGSCKNNVSEETSASFIRVTRIGEEISFAACVGC
jgi:hypothetical protein